MARLIKAARLFLAMPLLLAALPARAEMLDMPIVKLQSLDKTSARTMTFEGRVGTTLKFGPLYIKIQACREAPPIEQPESAAFLQIWEVTPQEESEWVFSGWMFSSSPSLSPMDHPVYDVWVLDCLEDKPAQAAAGQPAEGVAPPPEKKSEAVVEEPSADEQPPEEVPVQ